MPEECTRFTGGIHRYVQVFTGMHRVHRYSQVFIDHVGELLAHGRPDARGTKALIKGTHSIHRYSQDSQVFTGFTGFHRYSQRDPRANQRGLERSAEGVAR